MIKRLIIFGVLLLSVEQVVAQQSFHFLELLASAHALALGGVVASGSASNSTGLWMQNPALLDSAQSGELLLDYQWFYAGVRQSNLAYVQDFSRAGPKWAKAGVWGFGLQYLDYGKMDGYDAAGEPTGEFLASEYVLQLSHARHWKEVYNFGGSLKWASSGIAAYNSNALLLDVGGAFRHPGQEFTAGFAVRNLGLVSRSYTENQTPDLPLEVKMGVTFKPKFMPIRFTVTARHLQRPDLSIGDPAAPFNKEDPSMVDNVMRHFTAGGEFLLSKNLNLRAGYNHLRRKELSLENAGGASGFSFGLMLRVKSFRIDYTRSIYHLVGGTSQLSLVTDMNRIFKNKI